MVFIASRETGDPVDTCDGCTVLYAVAKILVYAFMVVNYDGYLILRIAS